MKQKPKPDPPHVLDYLARIKVEGINVPITVQERMNLLVNMRSLSA